MARKKGGWRSLLGLGGDAAAEATVEPSSEGGMKPVVKRAPTEPPPSTASTGPTAPGSGGAGESTLRDDEPARNEPAEAPSPAPSPPPEVAVIAIELDEELPIDDPATPEPPTAPEPDDALLAELHELRTEVSWLRGALEQQILAKKRAEEEVRILADHDPLTGVASARRFVDRLGVALIHAQRHKQKLAVIQLGLDNFGDANRRFGRTVGDDLLKSVALALESTLRQTDTIARVEDDAFTILLPGIKHDQDVGVIADKLRLALRSPFSIGGHEIVVTASMGIALFPEDGLDHDALMQSAQVAIRRAKEKGGDTYDIHAPRTSAMAAERLARERSLRRALVQGELALYWQPVVDCENGRIVGVEALLRWRNPDRMMPAAEFIPMAEVTGLAVPLGQWTLRHACLQGKAWHDAGHPGLVISVNVSARQLQHASLVRLVKRVLDETGLDPGCLELEVSEPELVRNPELSIERLNALKELGVRLALDDFGTGDSVLTHLFRYPLDSLKIDGAVIRDVSTDKNHEAVATAAIALAKARKIKVVAEGVETEAQRILLVRWLCDRMQGNLCGPPASAPETEKLLLRQQKTARAMSEEPKPRS